MRSPEDFRFAVSHKYYYDLTLVLPGKPPLSMMQLLVTKLHLRCWSRAFMSHRRSLKEPKIVATRFDVEFTQDRCRLVVVDCGCMMQFSNFLHLRLRFLKLEKGNQRRIECRNLLENCIRERGVVAQRVRIMRHEYYYHVTLMIFIMPHEHYYHATRMLFVMGRKCHLSCDTNVFL